MTKLRFGTAGIPLSTKSRSSQNGIKRLAELELGCMELEFVRGVQMKTPTASKVKAISEAEDIELTVHAPYYINLNAHESEKINASKERIIKAAKIGWEAGAKSVTFHAAFYLGDDPKNVYQNVKNELKEVRTRLNDEGIQIDLRPETTGSPTQFGTVPEIVKLAQDIPGIYPCVDWSHLHARSNGMYNTYDEFAEVLELIQNEIGKEALNKMHMHLSGIDYGPKGEKKHLELPDSDMNYKSVLQALIDFDVGGWLICESPNLEEDALLLQRTYHSLLMK